MTRVEIKTSTSNVIIKSIAYFSLFLIGMGFYLYQAVVLLLSAALLICCSKRKLYLNGTVLLLLSFSLCNYLVMSSHSLSGIIHQFAIGLVFFSSLQLGSDDEPIVELTGSIYSLGGCRFVGLSRRLKEQSQFSEKYLIRNKGVGAKK